MAKKLPEVGEKDAVIRKQRPIKQADIIALREEQGIEPKAGALDKPLPVDLNVPIDAIVGGGDEPKAVEEPEDVPVGETAEKLPLIDTSDDPIAQVTKYIQDLNDNGGNYRFVASKGEDDQYAFNIWSGKLLILVGATVESIKTDL